MFLVVPSVCIRDVKGPRDCGSAVFIVGIFGVGDKRAGDTRTIGVGTLSGGFCEQFPDFGLSFSTAEVSAFLEYQVLE
jgi:hypothetical protein